MKKLTILSTRTGKTLFIGLLCLLLSIAGHVQSETITITDLDTTDDNIITKIENEQWIYEDYNEKFLVPYPSHDGMGIVNSKGGFFDKKVDYTDVTDNTIYYFHFYITNTTPFNWSDYHFEFWNSDFTARLANFPLEAVYGLFSDQFSNKALVGKGGVANSVAEFWAPGSHDIGETGYYRLQIALYDIFDVASGSFGIRQVATTTPEPATMLLLGSGLIGIVGVRRKFKK